MNIGIIGGSGYTGGELLRILAGHPEANVVAVTSRSRKGQKVSDTHTHLRKIYDLEFEDLAPEEHWHLHMDNQLRARLR